MKVSIITPCLNSSGTIWQTIESVLNQTYKDIEYIVVDGGSHDGTLDIIREYQPKFQGRMKYVSGKDGGIYDAMNKGIKMSHGKLIGIINSDDFYELDAVDSIVSHMTSAPYQVIYGYCRMFDGRRTVDILKNSHENLNNQMIPHPSCFVTRKTYCNLGLFLTVFRVAGDYELMCRFYRSKKVVFTQIRKVVANFRVGGMCSNINRSERERLMIAYYYKVMMFRDKAVSKVLQGE